MTTARLNGIEIDYEAPGRGRAVLLSHGYSATHRMWDGQHRALGDRYRVISWSMRGHGATESPTDPAQYSADLTVAEMREAMGHHRSAQGLAHAARGMLAQEGSRVIDGLPGIRVPTLIVVGDRDQPFLAPCEYMAKKIPGARLEVIAGAGHSANLDQPEAFNRVLLDFLAALPPA